jgi:hypothetical protein
MTVKGQNFEVFQGENKQLIIAVTDENGAALPLTGYDITWVMYNMTNGSILLQKSSDNLGEVSVDTPSSGYVTITLDSEDTENIVPKTYGHQCESIDAFAQHSMLTTGQVDILKSHSHPEH